MAVPPGVAPPVTVPELEPMVATVVLPLAQTPLPVASLSVVVVPGHTFIVPVIAAGDGLTVIVVVVVHPNVDVNVITEVPPGFGPPFTKPVLAFIVATVVLLLLHVPDVASFNVVVVPVQMPVVPVMVDGDGYTVSTAVAAHPVAKVYEIMVVVLPGGCPKAIPVDPMVADVGTLLAHVPEPVASLSDVVAPGHTVSVPPIDAGNGFTVTVIDLVQPNGDV